MSQRIQKKIIQTKPNQHIRMTYEGSFDWRLE